MNNYAAVIEYDGTNFKGFQLQPGDLRTVQGELLEALATLADDVNNFNYAGRTDAGVHARHQVISFKTKKEINFYRFKWKLNCLLPDDIAVKDIKKVSETFDARRDAVSRQYCYFIVNNNYQSVFLKKYSILVTKKLDIDAMRIAAAKFLGKKDFSAFCNNNLSPGYTYRQVYDFKIRKFPGGLLVLRITANSFLYNMVRIIAGTLLEIGKSERDIETIDRAFKSKKREDAGNIIPPKGLFLTKVTY